MEKLIEYLKENVDVIDSMVNECNSWDGSLESYKWYNHDEDFYETFFESRDEVARAVYYGGDSYRYMDSYVRFNAYGNLETCCEYDIERDLIDGVEEIFDTWLELYKNDNIDLYDDTFMTMVKEYLGGEDSE